MRALLCVAAFFALMTPATADTFTTRGYWNNGYAVAHYAPHRHHVKRRTHIKRHTRHIKRRVYKQPSLACLTPKMRTVWAYVTAHWGPLRVVSTCRPGAFIRNTHVPSYHRYGMAIDFMAPRGKKRAMVKWLHLHTLGGVMTYSNFKHIHIDVGPRFLITNARG